MQECSNIVFGDSNTTPDIIKYRQGILFILLVFFDQFDRQLCLT